MATNTRRSKLTPLPEYFDRYIILNDDVPVLDALETSLKELKDRPFKTLERIGENVYAPGKWKVKDIFQHLIDAERIFCYRALSFARGDQEAPSFDEQLYGTNARACNRRLEDLIEEFLLVRGATLSLFKSFDDHMLSRVGIGFRGPYSVHDIGFIISGHQRWHFNTIEEKYVPLIKS